MEPKKKMMQMNLYSTNRPTDTEYKPVFTKGEMREWIHTANIQKR